MAKTTVAVIGGGPLGLMALKNMSEDGFDVTCFEARPYIGGVWQYSKDSGLSVQEMTRFNSSRFRSAISDFPFPDDTDDFPTWQQLNKYINDYADHFQLKPYIKLNSPVVGLSRREGKWGVEYISKELDGAQIDWFDKVVIAIGTFVQPKKVVLDGIEKFEGRQMHAIDFHRAEEFRNKNVLLIGLHATSQDVTTVLKDNGAKKVYISHKNGVLMVSKSCSTIKST
jgi:dimethylaniline monooxygenase (N-oxide forming) / hypotaurine monooxygenase